MSKNEWSYTSTPPITPSWRGDPLKKQHRGKFTFYLTSYEPAPVTLYHTQFVYTFLCLLEHQLVTYIHTNVRRATA